MMNPAELLNMESYYLTMPMLPAHVTRDILTLIDEVKELHRILAVDELAQMLIDGNAQKESDK